MNYSEFKEYVKSHILEHLPEEYASAEVSVNPVTKNNGLVLDGLSILKENENISPTIYLNAYYDDLDAGYHTLEEVMNEIAGLRIEHDKGIQVEAVSFTEFDKVKDKIYFQVVNAEYNKSLLEEVPHEKVENLAIIYRVLAIQGDDKIGSARISNDMMKLWGVNQEQIHEIAMKNTPELMPPKISSMFDTLNEMGMVDASELNLESDFGKNQMYVLTNESKLSGNDGTDRKRDRK